MESPRERIARPALDLRARLSDRQPEVLRRHGWRLASRIGLLLVGDIGAFLAARSLLRVLASRPEIASRFPGNPLAAGPLANPGAPGSLVFFVTLLFALALLGSYSRHRGLNTSARLGGAVMLAAAAAALPLAALIGVPFAIAQAVLVGLVTWLAMLVVRAGSERFLASVWPRDRWASPALLVGPANSRTSRAVAAISRPGGDYTIAGHHRILHTELPTDPRRLALDVQRMVEKIEAEAVVLCDPLPEPYLRALLDIVLETGSQLLYPARAVRIEEPRPRLVWHHDQPFFELGAPVLKMSAVAIKRATDVLVSSLLIVFLLPLLFAVAAGVKLDSRGPVFFRQHRAGRGGRSFDMIKFRTMRIGADGEKLALAHLNHTGDTRLFKIPSDPRVTRFGWLLRRWSLDELPQLWNVLRGDMSLVGPRPFFESDFAAYEDHHFRRLDTKPGITGLWQVSGRSEVVDFEDVVFLDRQYIEQWSVWLDVSILLRTISAVVRRTGAY